MWHDGKFTYIRSGREESFGVYELRDGEPAVVPVQLAGGGLYILHRVVGDGWLQIGDRRARWRFEPREGSR